MSKPSNLASLFDERSLSELLEVYEDAFPRPMVSKCIGFWAAILCFLLLSSTWYIKGISGELVQTSTGIMAGFALTIGASLMGVVIAGMSIFATSLNSNIAKNLISTNYPGTSVSSLKFIFAMFSHILFHLLVLISLCGVNYIFLGKDSLIFTTVQTAYNISQDGTALKILLLIHASILIGDIILLASLLKSFIWNLHQVLLTVAAFNSFQANKEN